MRRPRRPRWRSRAVSTSCRSRASSAPGFIVNRVLMPYLQEAMRVAQEGVALPVIDKAAVDFGMPMGPVELADVVGLDVCQHVGKIIAAELGREAPNLSQLDELVAQKKLGRKTGSGFYEWKDGKAIKPPTGGVAAPPDLIDRLILILVNECVATLREGVAERAGLRGCRSYFRYRFRAVPRRPARVRAQSRHCRSRRPSNGACREIRFSFSAG